jgi:arylsulfatase A-like enzyme
MSQPNLILIVADDMGYGDFGAFSDGRVHTPNLDRLIDEGVCLTQHYSGSPVCSPARAALLTGRYPHRTGAITPQEVRGMDRISLRETTLGDVFQSSGYATGLIGKWHNGALDDRYHPNARGFDEFVGFRGGWMDYWDWRIERNGVHEQSDGRYLTDVFSSEAIDFVRRHQAEPFMLCLMYNAPHSPLHAPEAVTARYIEAGFSESVAMTYAMIEQMDHGVGLLLDELDALGLSGQTIVSFTSDNGPAMQLRPDQVPEGVSVDTERPNAGFRGAKGSVYEGGIRVPWIMRWPDGLSPTRSSALIHFTDWLPTLSGIAGVDIPTRTLPLDGRDVIGTLRGETADDRKRFWQFNAYSPVYASNAAMRDGRWKLVRPALTIQPADDTARAIMDRYIELDIAYKYHPDQVTELMRDPEPERLIPTPLPPELYDVALDPFETLNLTEQNPDRVSTMLSSLEAWCEEVEYERAIAQAETLATP